MKKLLFTFCFAFLFGIGSFAQSPDYEDLLALFVDEKYEKVLRKAEGYTLGDNTKKDPIPYLFMSMAYFEMSKRDEFKEYYPNAFNESLKYISKYSSKDKEKKFGAEYEDYFNTLRKAAISEAEIMVDQQKFTKAKTMYKYLIDMDPNDAGAYIMQGMAFNAMKSKKEAEIAFKKAKDLISTKQCSTTNKDQLAFLKTALINYANQLSEGGQKSLAIEWLDLGKEFFPEDKEYQVNYDTIAG